MSLRVLGLLITLHACAAAAEIAAWKLPTSSTAIRAIRAMIEMIKLDDHADDH